jgi:hypothetical protein
MQNIFLEKGKGFPVGTIRVWNGNRYQKQVDKSWKFIGKDNKENTKSGYEDRPEKLREVEEEIKTNRTEVLYAMDDNGNVTLNKGGNEHSVQIKPDEQMELKDKILTHNHPNIYNDSHLVDKTISFSEPDIIMAAKNKVKEIRAVGPDGYIYSLSKGDFEQWGEERGVSRVKLEHKIQLSYIMDNFRGN